MTFKEAFNNWISQLNKVEGPTENIVAYNFGIFQNEENGYTIYLIGSATYDEDDDDWASGFGDYAPQDRYLKIDDPEFKNLDWEAAHQKIETTITEFITTDIFRNSFLSKAKAITVGFDDGELVRVR
jgi:hypothetical protein